MIAIADIEAARERIAPYIRRTPILEVTHASEPLPVSARVVLKLELNRGHPVFHASNRICALVCGAGAEGTVI